MKNEPTPKSTSDTEALSPAAKEFSRVIAAALAKHWQQERQSKPPASGGISR